MVKKTTIEKKNGSSNGKIDFGAQKINLYLRVEYSELQALEEGKEVKLEDKRNNKWILRKA